MAIIQTSFASAKSVERIAADFVLESWDWFAATQREHLSKGAIDPVIHDETRWFSARFSRS